MPDQGKKSVVRNGEVFDLPGWASDSQIDDYFRKKFGDSSRTWGHVSGQGGAGPETPASMQSAPSAQGARSGSGGLPSDFSMPNFQRSEAEARALTEDNALLAYSQKIYEQRRQQFQQMAEESGTPDPEGLVDKFYAAFEDANRGRDKLNFSPEAAQVFREQAAMFSPENWIRRYGGKKVLTDKDREEMRREIQSYYFERQNLQPEDQWAGATGIGRGLINYGSNAIANLTGGALDLGDFQTGISEQMSLRGSGEAQQAKAAGVDISRFMPTKGEEFRSQVGEGAGAGIGMILGTRGLGAVAGKALRLKAAAPAAEKTLSLAQKGVGIGKNILRGATIAGVGSALGSEPGYKMDPETGEVMTDPDTGEPVKETRLEAMFKAGKSGAYMGATGGAIASILNKIPPKVLPIVGKLWDKDIIRLPIVNSAGNYLSEKYLRIDGTTPTDEELAQAATLGLIFGVQDWWEVRIARSKIPEIRKNRNDERAVRHAERDIRASILPDIAATYGFDPEVVKAKIEAKRRPDKVLGVELTGNDTQDLAVVLDMDPKTVRESKLKFDRDRTAKAAEEAERLAAEEEKAKVDSARVKALVDTGEFTEDEARAAIVEQEKQAAGDERDSAAADALGVTIAQYRKLREQRRAKKAEEEAAKSRQISPSAADAERMRASLRLQERLGVSREDADQLIADMESLPEEAGIPVTKPVPEAPPLPPETVPTIPPVLAGELRQQMVESESPVNVVAGADQARQMKMSLFLQDKYGMSEQDANEVASMMGDVVRRPGQPFRPDAKPREKFEPSRRFEPTGPKQGAMPPEADVALTPEQQRAAASLRSALYGEPPPPPASGGGGTTVKPGPGPKAPPAAPKQAPPAAPKQAPTPAPAAAPAEPAPAPKRAGLGGRKKAVTTADETEQARLREAEAEAEREAVRDVPEFDGEPEAVVEGAAATKKAAPKAKPTAAPTATTAPKAAGLGGRRRAAAPAEPGTPRRPGAEQIAKMRATPTLSGRLDVSERSNSPASHEIAQALLSENALGIESADRPARVMNNQYISRMMSGEFAPPIGGGEPNPEAKIAENSIARLRIPGLSQSDARRIAIGGGTPEEYDLVSRINKTEIAGALGIIRKVARTVAPRVGIAVTRSIDGNIDRAIESGLVRLGEDKRQTILQSIFARSQELGVGSTRQALPDSLKRLSINNILAGKNPENRLPLIVANEAEIASLYDETRQAMVGKGASQERAHEIASRVVNERIAQYVLKSIESGTFIGTNRQRANTLAYAKSSKAAADRQRLANDIENPVVVEPVPQTVEEALSSPAFQPTPGGLTGLMKTAKPEPSAAPPRQELSPGTIKEAKVSRTAGLIPGSAVPALGVGSPKRVEPVGTPSAIVDAVIRGEPAMSPSTTAAILEQAAVSMSEAGGLGTKNKSVQILKGLAEAFREGTVAKFVEAGRKRDGRRFDQAMRAGLNRADIEAEALRGEPRSEGTRGFRTPGNVRRRIEIEGEVGMREATPNAGEEFYNTPAAEILSSAGTAKEILTDAAIGRLISDIPGSPGFAEKYGDLWGKAVERDALSRGYDEEEAKVIRDHERLLAIDANLVSDDKMTVTQQRNIARRKGRMKQMLTNLERNLPDNWAEDSQQLYGDSRAYTPEPAAEGEGARLSKFVSDLKSPRFGGVEQSTTPGVRVPANSQLALELSAPNEIAPARRRELLALFERRRAQAEQMFEDGELTRNGFKRLIEIVDHYTAVLSGMPAPRPKGAGAFYTQEGAPVEGAPYNEGIGRMVERGREVAGGQEFMFFDQRATDAARIIGEGPGVEIDLRASQPQTKIGVRRTGIGGRPSRDLSQMGAAYNPAALLFEAAVKGGKVLVDAVKKVLGAASDAGRRFMARVRAAKGDPVKIREAVDEAVKGVTPQPVADVTAEAVGETMSMAGRVKSVGGAVAARVGEMFKQTADETRRFEGELSVEERELMEASGGLFAAGRSFGPLNSPERQAAASLAEIIPVPGTNYGESKFQQAIEGRYEGALTPQERRIVDAAIRLGARTLELAKGVGMLRLNRTTGKLEGYENVPAGREGMVFRNMPTQEMTEIISVGKAHTMWPELVDAIQQKNPDKSTVEIEEALMERHNALRQMGVSSSEKTSALEFFREFQMPAGLVRENGKVVPLFETNPSKWGKAMVRSSATRLGFVSVFGQDFAYNPDTMEIEPDLPSPIDIQKEEYSMSVDRRKRGLAEGYFDQARRVAEGRLLEPPSERETGVPQRAARLLIDFINSPIKTMKLSASPLYNALEPFGMAAEQAGYGNVFEAYSDAILSGLYNLTNGKFGSESAAKIFRNLERMGAMGVERVSSQRFVTGVAARAMELSVAKMKARKAGGPGADDDSARLVQMGYDQATANRLARGGGTDAEYDRLIRGAGPSATGGRMSAVEKSRLENTRWFKTWFPIATYATRQLQQFVRTAKMAYDTPKMGRPQAEAATKQILKMAGGRAASGTAQNLMFAFFIGGTAGLRAAWSALKDDPLDKIIEGATSSVFSGPYAGVAQNMMRGDDSIFKTIFPLAVVMEAGDLLTNGGRYENLEPGDKLVEATQWLIPAVKVVSGLGSTAMSILGDDDISREVKQVKSAYYRWAREEKIRRPFGGILNPTEADEAFARAMKRARRAIESRQPEKAGQYLREAMGVEGKDARSVATSLDRVRVLKSLDEAQLDSLRRKIGEKNFQILVAEDDLIESIVKSFAGDRKGKAKVTMFPEGRVQSSFGLGRAR